MGDSTFRVIRALIRGRAGVSTPSRRSNSDLNSNSAVNAADTGYPGSPSTGLPAAIPNATGCPGRIAMAMHL